MSGARKPLDHRVRGALGLAGLLALLAVVGLAAGGRPLGFGSTTGHTPSPTFFDFAWTTVVLVLAVWLAVSIWLILSNRVPIMTPARPRRWWLTLPIFFTVVALLSLALFGARGKGRLLPQGTGAAGRNPNSGLLHQKPKGPVHTSRFRWEEPAVLLGLALVVGLVVALRRRGTPPLPRVPELRRLTRDSVALALGDAVDDLRADPDLRRAIVAAYARTERALAAAGLPRRPAETPHEYLERTLAGLDASAPAIRRLTELFEWAKFSAHDPEPWMRDEAVDAFLAVRDELREPAAEPAAA